MKKKIIVIGIIGMFLLTSATAMSTAIREENVPEPLLGDEDTVYLFGYARTLFLGLGIKGVTVTCEAEDPEVYSETNTPDDNGYYRFDDILIHSKLTVSASKKGCIPTSPNPFTIKDIRVSGFLDFTFISFKSRSSQQPSITLFLKLLEKFPLLERLLLNL